MISRSRADRLLHQTAAPGELGSVRLADAWYPMRWTLEEPNGAGSGEEPLRELCARSTGQWLDKA